MKSKILLLFHGFPLLVILFPFVWFAIVGNDRMLKGEAGIVENLTVLFLVVAIGFCIASLSRVKRLVIIRFIPAIVFNPTGGLFGVTGSAQKKENIE